MAVAHGGRRRGLCAHRRTHGNRFGRTTLRRALLDLEHRHRHTQARSLLVERLRSRGSFLDERRVLLRDLVHLRDRARDLVDAAALFLGCGGDLAHDVGHALHGGDHFRHRAACLVDERRAGADAFDRRVDQHLDLLRGRRRALREAAHLARDHREAAAFLAGARGLDRRIQRENVGLERDPFDDRDDVRDLCRTLVDLAHRADHLPDDRIALVCNLRRVRGERARLACIVRVLFHGAGELFHARRGFLQRRRLFLGTRRQVDVAGRDLLRRGRDRFAAAAHRADGLDEPALHLRKPFQQLPHFVAAVRDDPAAQVTRRDRIEMRECVGERPGDRAAQRDIGHQCEAQPDHERDDRHDAGDRVDRLRVSEAGLPGGELKVAQRLVRHREIVEQHLQLLRAFADPLVIVRRDHRRERVESPLQHLALRDHVLCELVLVGVARQVHVLLPPHVRLLAHLAAARDRLGRIGRADQQRGAVERETLARGVQFRNRDVDRARHLVREYVLGRVVRAAHADQPQHAERAQQPRQNRHRQPDAGTNRQVSQHHRFSCLASSLTGRARRPRSVRFTHRIYDNNRLDLMVFYAKLRTIHLLIACGAIIRALPRHFLRRMVSPRARRASGSTAARRRASRKAPPRVARSGSRHRRRRRPRAARRSRR
ncbi:hypothetical protein BST28156_06999 [Burkholderia stagnalis]|nr:hypothetical protein BST28156_06999 [Burkholderia stagnalis]